MTPPFSTLLLGSIITIAAATANGDHHPSRTKKDNDTKQLLLERRQQVKTTLCSTQDCHDQNGEAEQLGICKSYLTPISICYNAKFLFPDDESWSDVDILDELHYNRPEMKKAPPDLKRTFFTSTDGSCLGVDYSWIQPFEVCEGPFGSPRPWGEFSLVVDGDDFAANNGGVVQS